MSRNFFEEFIRKDFFEKEASENENIKSALGEVSPEVLEKLAEELGVMSNSDMVTLEEKLASDCEDKEDEEVKESSDCEDKKDEEEKESSDCEDKKDEEEKESSDCEDKKDEENKESSDCEKEDDEEEKKESSESENKEDEDKKSSVCGTCGEDEEEEGKPCCKEEKEAHEIEEQLLKNAYEIAEQRLIENEMSLEDYVFNKCANEEVTYFVSENAEKLAFLTDKSVLQVADDILDTLIDKIG